MEKTYSSHLKTNSAGAIDVNNGGTIYDNAGNVVDVMTTDENGVATSKELRLGTYKYKETKAPDYVVIDDAEYVFKLTENNQVVTRSVENKLKRENLNSLFFYS